jgi:hypothetical protein
MPSCRRWVMSFERTNLHFTVRRKARTDANFAELLAAGRSWFRRCGDDLAEMCFAASRNEEVHPSWPHAWPRPFAAWPAAARGEAEPTIVYTLTRREAADLAAELGVGCCRSAWLLSRFHKPLLPAQLHIKAVAAAGPNSSNPAWWQRRWAVGTPSLR